MSYRPKTRLEKILCGVEIAARSGLEKAVQTALERAGRGALTVPFTAAEDGGTMTVATEADFAETAEAVAEGRAAQALVTLPEGQQMIFPLVATDDADELTALIFGQTADIGEGPTLFSITFTAAGAQVTALKLTAASE